MLPPLRRGTRIAGRYELQEELGCGGMGAVWLAHDHELERSVAVKFRDPDAEEARFEREANALAALSHPHIVAIYDYGSAEGRRYLVLEYLAGGTLADRLAGGEPLPDAETERIAQEVAAALAHAHGAGIVHRDLKPSNIVFDAEGRAKLTDFGIARSSRETTLTDAGTLLGTAAYVAPEQAAGATIGPAADVYSFGVVLFQALTGRLPVEPESPQGHLAEPRAMPEPSVAAYRPQAPGHLSIPAERALARDPAARPPDGAALVEELGEPVMRTDAPTDPVGLTAPAKSRPRPGRRTARLAALGLLAATGFAAAWLVFAPEDSTPSLPPPSSGTRSDRPSESAAQSVTTGTSASSVADSGTSSKAGASDETTDTTSAGTTSATTPATTSVSSTSTDAGTTIEPGTTSTAG
jgi:serine/threonine protein kinase